jgi:hypothetical protein
MRIIHANFGPFRGNRFQVITIFANFNWRPAAILDFHKILYMTTKSCLGCRDEAWIKIWWQSDVQLPSYSI